MKFRQNEIDNNIYYYPPKYKVDFLKQCIEVNTKEVVIRILQRNADCIISLYTIVYSYTNCIYAYNGRANYTVFQKSSPLLSLL